jgi:hypothetical protein
MPRRTCPALISIRPAPISRSFNSIVARFSSAMAREYQKAGGVCVARRNQHRMMGVSQSTHTCPLTASACAVFRQ